MSDTNSTLAVRTIGVDENIKPILKTSKSGSLSLMNFVAFIKAQTGKDVKGIKGDALKQLVGVEKLKTLRATFNATKGAFHVWSAKVDALTAGDPSMRKSTTINMGKSGAIGVTVRKRFVNDPAVNAVSLELAAAKARIAELEAAAVPAKA
jgi:hypothetical protein